MSEFTKPLAVLSYANTAGILATTIYTNNKLNVTNQKLKDVAEDVDMIRDGIKEKVPVIENNIKHLDNVIKNIVSVFNNQTLSGKKKNKKLCSVVEELAIRLEESENRYARLLNELKNKSVLDTSVLDSIGSSIVVAPPPPPKPAPKSILSRRLVSDSSSSDSESEVEKHKSKKKSKKSKVKSDSEEDEIEKVVRLARSKH